MRHTIQADKWYRPPGYDGIDRDEWGDRAERYFIDDFDLPPLLPGADDIRVLIGQLTPAQYAQQSSICYDHASTPPLLIFDWVKFMIVHGVRDLYGFEVEGVDGSVSNFKLKFEQGLYGKRMTDESFEALLPFSEELITGLASKILYISGRRSLPTTHSTPKPAQ
jgi:hypothetical protein